MNSKMTCDEMTRYEVSGQGKLSSVAKMFAFPKERADQILALERELEVKKMLKIYFWEDFHALYHLRIHRYLQL